MRTKLLLLVAAGAFLATASVRGHHAFGGEFDPNKPVLLKGPVTKVEWVNPHAWIHIEVTDPDGSKLFLGSSGTGAPTDGADPADAAKPPTGRGRGGR